MSTYKYFDLFDKRIVNGIDLTVKRLNEGEIKEVASSHRLCYFTFNDKRGGHYSYSNEKVLIAFARELWNISVPVNFTFEGESSGVYPDDVESGLEAISRVHNGQALKYHVLIGAPEDSVSHVGVIGHVKWMTEYEAEEATKKAKEDMRGRFRII